MKCLVNVKLTYSTSLSLSKKGNLVVKLTGDELPSSTTGTLVSPSVSPNGNKSAAAIIGILSIAQRNCSFLFHAKR